VNGVRFGRARLGGELAVPARPVVVPIFQFISSAAFERAPWRNERFVGFVSI